MKEPLLPRCAVPGCTVIIERGRLMCHAHWRLVPVKLARSVYRAVAAPKHAPAGRGGDEFRTYSAVRQTAIDVVSRQLSP